MTSRKFVKYALFEKRINLFQIVTYGCFISLLEVVSNAFSFSDVGAKGGAKQ